MKPSGELCLQGGPTLGYVPVLYPESTEPLTLRANDVTALNVAWQFFLNGLNYDFLPLPLRPFFGVYFTPSPTDAWQIPLIFIDFHCFFIDFPSFSLISRKIPRVSGSFPALRPVAGLLATLQVQLDSLQRGSLGVL